MANIECLKDCNANCCRKNPNLRVIYDFSDSEVHMFAQHGMTLPPRAGGYVMPDDCVFLLGKRCILHETDEQPECCAVNVAGGKVCTNVLASASGKRYSEVE